MTYQPSSKILILTICSFTKTAGGVDEYNVQDAIVSRLSQKAKSVLLQSRADVWYLLKLSDRIDWQGVPASELAFNQGLVQGIDLGGHDKPARYLPALQRYDGRFFQSLKKEGASKLEESSHHFLFMSGLYGLVIPDEPIQLYSCPLRPQVAEVWTKDHALTDVLIDYVAKHSISRIFDLTAVAAYRNLIDWSVVTAQTKADVLHCFYTMGAGDYALIPFGQLTRDFLSIAPASELLIIEPETDMNGVVFRSVQVTLPGLPDELKVIRQAEREIPLLEPHPVEFVSEVLAGGRPIKSRELAEPRAIYQTTAPDQADWMFSITSEFRKEVSKLDKKMEGRVMEAIVEICRDPLTQRGDTWKPLTGELRGMWRYRLGDYRLICKPEKPKHTVFLLAVGARGGIYPD
jgi:mRNA-degrading endonuclease RelE of RelBE toxin-antitoxin system